MSKVLGATVPAGHKRHWMRSMECNKSACGVDVIPEKYADRLRDIHMVEESQITCGKCKHLMEYERKYPVNIHWDSTNTTATCPVKGVTRARFLDRVREEHKDKAEKSLKYVFKVTQRDGWWICRVICTSAGKGTTVSIIQAGNDPIVRKVLLVNYQGSTVLICAMYNTNSLDDTISIYYSYDMGCTWEYRFEADGNESLALTSCGTAIYGAYMGKDGNVRFFKFDLHKPTNSPRVVSSVVEMIPSMFPESTTEVLRDVSEVEYPITLHDSVWFKDAKGKVLDSELVNKMLNMVGISLGVSPQLISQVTENNAPETNIAADKEGASTESVEISESKSIPYVMNASPCGSSTPCGECCIRPHCRYWS